MYHIICRNFVWSVHYRKLVRYMISDAIAFAAYVDG